MKFQAILVVMLVVVLGVIGIRYAPTEPELYRDIAHHAVAVRKDASCLIPRSRLDELKAKFALWFIAWNRAGYLRYRASGKQLLNFTVEKLKCQKTEARFEIETARAIRAIELGLDKGEDIEAIDTFGDRPLHTAIYAGNHHVVEYLLLRGAELDAKNNDGETVFEIALSLVEAEIGYDAEMIESVLQRASRKNTESKP